MTQWEKYLNLYLKYKKALKLAPRTISDSEYHVRNLFKDKGDVDFSDIRELKGLVIEYFADNDNINPVTFNTRRKNLNTFFNWLVEEEYIEKSPMKSIKKAKEGHKPKHVSLDVVLQLLNVCDLNTYTGLRDYTCIALSIDTGIRPSEMHQLLYSDFNFENLQFTIPEEVAKTRVERTLPLNEKLIPFLLRLHEYHIEYGWSEENLPIFTCINKSPLNRFSWRRRLLIYSEKIGVKVTPYMLRHSAAMGMLRNKANVFHVQKMLGHTNLNTTRIYVNLDLSDLKEIHEETSPLDTVIGAS